MVPYTAVPNKIMEAQHLMNESEFRVTMALIRLTHGYHKAECTVSYDELQAMTGLSRGGVASGVAATNAKGFIVKTGRSSWKSLVYSVDQNSLTGRLKQSTEYTENSLTNRLNEGDTLYKKKKKKKKEKLKTENPPDNFLRFCPEYIATGDFLTAWGEWLQYHDDRGKPLRASSAKKQLADMGKWGPERSIAAIDFSIRQGYAGLFEPKVVKNGNDQTIDEILSTAFD